jgi:alkylation response protein AidB-like acyl-CoA dehydrogenase
MFVAELEVGATIEATGGTPDAALALVLPCWTLLGMLDRAVDLARAHVLVREQFGQPLSQFQAVQFQLTDAEVERRGAEMLARYALWSIGSGDPAAVQDALALRLAALEAADTVFRVAHQLHGALGFCDESTLSWISRYSQPIRRLPFGRSITEELLGAELGRRGLNGLFSDPARV